MKFVDSIKNKMRKQIPPPMMKRIKIVGKFIKNDLLFGTVLYHYGIIRHRALLKVADRTQKHTYTCFYRSPGQMEALVGPVMEILRKKKNQSEILQIHVFAGSTGAEAYTISSVLLKAFPDLDFSIECSDLHQHTVDYANAARYTEAEVAQGGVPKQFIVDTFDFIDGCYQVKDEIRSRVSITTADLLDPKLGEQFPKADIVFAQNVFFHLDPASARHAFRNVTQFLKPVSALFIDGMDLDMREEVTADSGFFPLRYKYGEIHEQARTHLTSRWWNFYYGTEPYAGLHTKRLRRYSTIFFKGVSPDA